jgi:peptidoglycan hydrolase-like protein with peptidoglycan-binding domain
MSARSSRLKDDGTRGWFGRVLRPVVQWIAARPADSFAATVAIACVITVWINALYLQSGLHRAPMIAYKTMTTGAASRDVSAEPVSSVRRSTDTKSDAASISRIRSDTIAEIQRELNRRGFYDGVIDGFLGPKTESAIREFSQVAGIKQYSDPGEPLLAAIVRSNVKARMSANRDSIAGLLAPTGRVAAVQRALSEFGYGPVKPTGIHDSETRAAIERFERARKRPATGQINEQLLRDLAALTGQPLE